MKKEYHEDTGATWVSFEAGQPFDASLHSTPFWRCKVGYMYSEYDKVYCVYSVQVVGIGWVDDKVTRETEMKSLREVVHLLNYLQDLETYYDKVYGE